VRFSLITINNNSVSSVHILPEDVAINDNNFGYENEIGINIDNIINEKFSKLARTRLSMLASNSRVYV
jgi:hypothetical protein